MLAVSRLLRELVDRVVVIGALVANDPRHCRLAEVVWDEIAQSHPVDLALTQPASLAARRLVESMEAAGFRLDALDPALRAAGHSRRTMERAFLRETEMTLGRWLRKQRLLFGDGETAERGVGRGCRVCARLQRAERIHCDVPARSGSPAGRVSCRQSPIGRPRTLPERVIALASVPEALFRLCSAMLP